jgi:oligoribonuclease NrnB/cAMP/cGMP phosphodiesterase (DHH superfamily)
VKLNLDNTTLITHRDCLDGAACALVFLYQGGRKENIQYVPAGMLERFVKDNQELMASDRFLLFADLGFNDVKYMDILDKRGNFLLVDHHVSSLGLAGRPNVVARKDACGSKLLAEVLELPDISSLNQFVDIVDDHDRWILANPESERWATLFTFLEQKRFVDRFSAVSPMVKDTDRELLVDLLLEKRQEAIDKDLKRVQKRFIGGFRAGVVVTSNPAISELCHQMLNKNPDIQVSVTVNLERGHGSFRSRGDVDVAALCATFGGGGHKASSGHRLSDALHNKIIDSVYGIETDSPEIVPA